MKLAIGITVAVIGLLRVIKYVPCRLQKLLFIGYFVAVLYITLIIGKLDTVRYQV